MDAQVELATELVVSKGKFAEMLRVSAGRVSQYISERKISGDALKGEGRNAQIRVAVAAEQLKKNLDITQRVANGLSNRLDQLVVVTAQQQSAAERPKLGALAAGSDQSPALPLTEQSVAPIAPVDSVEGQIKQQRLESLLRQNRKAAEDEAVRSGRLTDSAVVTQQMGRIAAQIVTVFDAALTDLATAIAARFELPQRDVLHLLKGEFRKIRSSAATTFKRLAEDLPARVDVEIEAKESELLDGSPPGESP